MLVLSFKIVRVAAFIFGFFAGAEIAFTVLSTTPIVMLIRDVNVDPFPL